MKDITFSGNGKIVSYTTIRTAPKGFDAPYIVGIIKLDEGPRITGQIVGEATTIDIDKCVKVVFRKLKEMSDGLNIYGFKFELI
ncbi:MAG: OB-fold domain-containing protein [Candidatus Aenigmatarchaeota archaeon]